MIWTIKNGDKGALSDDAAAIEGVSDLERQSPGASSGRKVVRVFEIAGVAVPTVYFNTSDDPAWVFD